MARLLQLTDESLEGKIQFLVDTGVDRERAERVASRPEQFNAYYADLERGISKIISGGDIGKHLSGLNNYAAAPGMTPEKLKAEAASSIADYNRRNPKETYQMVLENYKSQIEGMAKYLDPTAVKGFNDLVEGIKKYDSSITVTPLEVSSSTGSSSTSSTGTSGSTTLTQPRQSDYATFNEYLAANRAWLASKGKPKSGGSTGSSTDSSTTSSTGTTTTSTASDRAAAQQSAIDFINSQDLPADLKALYITAVQNWDPDTELNPANIIDTFNKIKSETIDPRFQGLLNIAISSVKNASEAMDKQRAIELETEGANAASALGSTQDALEASGLTSSGKGVKYLGLKGSGVMKFGGEEEVEGLVPQSNRLISTSSEARYLQGVKDLGLAAEEQLGSSGVTSLIPGYIPVGSVTGSLPESKQAAEGATLGNILNQGISNVAQDQLIDFTQS